MFTDAYKKAWEVIAKKPLRLWGFSLLGVLIILIAGFIFGSIAAFVMAVAFLVSCGMAQLSLDALGGKEATSEQFFAACSKEKILRVLGGMAWRALWCFIWSFVPVYGIYKIYTYSFVPYVLMTKEEVSALDALKMSGEMTKGKVLNMFLCDLCFHGGFWLLACVITALATVLAFTVVGTLISLVLVAVLVVAAAGYVMLAPVFTGLYIASFYREEITPAAFEIVAE